MPDHRTTENTAEGAHSPLAGNSDAPRQIDTPRRPGQPGAENERRPGPNPNSPHPTGPHAPYEAPDPDGLPAAKHR